jgi:hypothetical protein
VQRKQQVGECWENVDIFSPVSGRHIIAGPTYFWDHMILGGFRHMVFADGFLFPVKGLGFGLIQVDKERFGFMIQGRREVEEQISCSFVSLRACCN